MVGVQLGDYILQGNHAVFEHPIPGVFFAMSTVVQVHVLLIIWIDLGFISGFFYLFQDRLLNNYRIRVSKENTLQTVGEVFFSSSTSNYIPTRPLV